MSDFAATKSEFYDVGESHTSLGIGEAAVTILSENGVPTPVVHTRLRLPASRRGPADDVAGAAKASQLFAKYGTRVDSQSAREILAARLQPAAAAPTSTPAPTPVLQGGGGRPKRQQAEGGESLSQGTQALGKFLKSRQGKQLEKQVARGLFGLLKKNL